MKAGRELDALVAEKVMGLPPVYGPTGIKWDGPIPAYSTDIAAAWEVVERIKGSQPESTFSIEWIGTQWRVDFVYQNYDWYNEGDQADTAPHAICLAALKAVGYTEAKGS
jgi:hypothetical protein